jgi:hypothetical protein
MKNNSKEKLIENILKEKKGRLTLKGYVLEFLLDRQRQGPEYSEEINLDDIWYELRRTKFIPDGIEITKHTRKTVKSYVIELCDLLGKKRKDLGILAQAYATMYFQGEVSDVDIDQLATLANNGVDILIIEKEGIVEVLKPFADIYGIALVTSHGFLTENAANLSKYVERVRGNIAILTDFDISGLLIGLTIPGIHRIGVDFETLEYFGYELDEETLQDFEEEYDPEASHLKAVLEHAQSGNLPAGYIRLLSPKNLEYLSEKRIEINAVKSAVGAEKLWNFIMYKLKEAFPTRDYNRAISVETMAAITPYPLEELNDIFADWVADILEPSVKRYESNLQNYDGDHAIFEDDEPRDPGDNDYGFIDVKECKERMWDDFNEQLDNDADWSAAIDNVEVLTKRLRKRFEKRRSEAAADANG